MKIKNIQKVENLQKTTENILNSESSKSFKITELFKLGYEIKEIANLLNIRYNHSYNVIQNFIITQQIEILEETKFSKKDEIFELFKQNKSPKEIAISLKTNLNYIYKVINEIKESEQLK